MQRDGTGDAITVKTTLMEVPVPEALSIPVLLPRALFEFMTLLQPRSVLMSMASVTTKGLADAQYLDCCLKSWFALELC